MKSARYLALVLAAAGNSALAHHGVATLGAISLDGPGAPVETSSSATLGEGTWLVSLKVDHAKFETGRTPPPDQNAESEYNQYWLLTLGYGFKPWLTAYVTQPYNVKVDEPDSQDSRGLADMSVGAAIGMTWCCRVSRASVMRRIAPPLPAASMPSKTSTSERCAKASLRRARASRPCSFSSALS